MTAEQKTIYVEDIAIPVISKGEETFYPVTFIEKHILLRERRSITSGIKSEDKVKYEVNFKDWDGGIQVTNCISQDVLIERLARTQSRRLSIPQREQQNKLHRHLKMAELGIGEFEWDKYDMKWLNKLSSYEAELVSRIIKFNKDMKYRECKDCGKVLPLVDSFFHREKNRELFTNACILCKGTGEFYVSDDVYENYLLRVNSTLLPLYLQKNYLALFQEYSNKAIKRLPDEIHTKEYLKIIINDFHERKLIDESNLTVNTLKKTFRLDISKFEKASITEIYQWLYGEFFYLEKWKYPCYSFKGEIKLTKELTVQIFNNYLSYYNIEIVDPSTFDYQEILRACNLTGIIGSLFSGLGEFFVYYWEDKHAGYQFRELGNYYKASDSNILYDFKFLVEQDMKLEVEKIPLYITKGMLHRDYKNIYNFMRSDGRSLFYWFDILYPNRFIENDFTIGRYRNEFDSIEEQQVDGVLREYFPNVIYNYNSSDQVVELKGKRPDWFIMTEKGVWLVEYFGMYLGKQKQNPIIRDYIETTHEKIKLYEEMTGYNFLFVYPSDIDKGFLGLRVMLEELKARVG